MGYRYFVDTLVRVEDLVDSDREAIEAQFDQNLVNLEEILRESTHLLSKISQQLAVISLPQIGLAKLKRLELVELASNRIMVVLSVSSGFAKTLIFEIDEEISSATLSRVSTLLNERLTGLTLREIRESFADRMREDFDGGTPLIELFIQSSDKLFSENMDDFRIFIDGIRVIMNQPEFGDPNRLRDIIELVENHDLIIHVLNSVDESDTVSVRIGLEVEEERFKDYSLVSAPYNIGPSMGTVSIIGPRRMQYTRMVSLVDYISRLITQNRTTTSTK